MKVYVYKNNNSLRFETESVTTIIDIDSCHWFQIGMIDLPIEPKKKEVVKEKIPRVGIECVKVEGEKLTEPLWIPENAYDIKLTYKVKE